MPNWRDLYMGEGVCADANCILATHTLYSCSGIALVNRRRRRIGLYHYPSGSARNPRVQHTLHAMIRDVQPDQIVITPAARQTMTVGTMEIETNSGALPGDVNDLTRVLRQLSGVTPTQAPGRVLAGLLWNGNGPRFNVDVNNEPSGPPHDNNEQIIADNLQGQFSATARPLLGTARYYGASGEHENRPMDMATVRVRMDPITMTRSTRPSAMDYLKLRPLRRRFSKS